MAICLTKILRNSYYICIFCVVLRIKECIMGFVKNGGSGQSLGMVTPNIVKDKNQEQDKQKAIKQDDKNTVKEK